MKKLFFFMVLISYVVLTLHPVYATRNYEISILDMNENKSFYPVSDLYVSAGDTISWYNNDTKTHRIISSNIPVSHYDKFESGEILPGNSFSYTIKSSNTETIQYYDKKSTLTGFLMLNQVPQNFKIFNDWGYDMGNHQTFDIEYLGEKLITSYNVEKNQNSLNLTLTDVPHANYGMIIKIPRGLISGNLKIFSNDVSIKYYILNADSNNTILMIPVNSNTENLSIVGNVVIPEFGVNALLVFILALVIIMCTKFYFYDS